MQPAPGPFTPPPAANTQQIRPPLWWFGVAAGIGVVGIGVAIALFVIGFMRMTDKVDDFTRIDVPGTGTVEIDEPGGYSVYYEYPGVSDDFYDPFASEPAVTIIDPSGDEVLLEPYDSEVTYNFGGHEGEALWSFDADEPGAYEVTTEGDMGTEIAVGPGLGHSLVAYVVAGLAVGGLGLVGGTAMAIVVGVRRSRSRRQIVAARMQQAAARGPGAPGAAWGPLPSPWAAPGPAAPAYGPTPGAPPAGPVPPPGWSAPSGQPGQSSAGPGQPSGAPSGQPSASPGPASPAWPPTSPPPSPQDAPSHQDVPSPEDAPSSSDSAPNPPPPG